MSLKELQNDLEYPLEFYFHNKQHYNRFLCFVDLGTKFNRCLDDGYLIYNEDTKYIETNKFEFEIVYNESNKYEEPSIVIKDNNCSYVYIGSCHSESTGKIFIEDTIKDIKQFFKEYKIYKPINFKIF